MLDLTNAPKEPWNATDATRILNQLSKDPRLNLAYKLHAQERLQERNIIMSDVLRVLKTGFVLKQPVEATQAGRFKYEIEGKSPNSDGRSIRLIAIPCVQSITIKLVTVMWVDETSTRAGTITGVNE